MRTYIYSVQGRVDPRNAQTFADLASLVVEHLSTVGFSRDDTCEKKNPFAHMPMHMFMYMSVHMSIHVSVHVSTHTCPYTCLCADLTDMPRSCLCMHVCTYAYTRLHRHVSLFGFPHHQRDQRLSTHTITPFFVTYYIGAV